MAENEYYNLLSNPIYDFYDPSPTPLPRSRQSSTGSQHATDTTQKKDSHSGGPSSVPSQERPVSVLSTTSTRSVKPPLPPKPRNLATNVSGKPQPKPRQIFLTSEEVSSPVKSKSKSFTEALQHQQATCLTDSQVLELVLKESLAEENDFSPHAINEAIAESIINQSRVSQSIADQVEQSTRHTLSSATSASLAKRVSNDLIHSNLISSSSSSPSSSSTSTSRSVNESQQSSSTASSSTSTNDPNMDLTVISSQLFYTLLDHSDFQSRDNSVAVHPPARSVSGLQSLQSPLINSTTASSALLPVKEDLNSDHIKDLQRESQSVDRETDQVQAGPPQHSDSCASFDSHVIQSALSKSGRSAGSFKKPISNHSSTGSKPLLVRSRTTADMGAGASSACSGSPPLSMARDDSDQRPDSSDTTFFLMRSMSLTPDHSSRLPTSATAGGVGGEIWTHEGFLLKTGPTGASGRRRRQNFVRRWVNLDGHLMKYSILSFSPPKGQLLVSDICFIAALPDSVSSVQDLPSASVSSKKSDQTFKTLFSASYPFEVGVMSRSWRVYQWASPYSAKDRTAWMKSLGCACVRYVPDAQRLINSLMQVTIMGFVYTKYGIAGKWTSTWAILSGRELYLVDLPIHLSSRSSNASTTGLSGPDLQRVHDDADPAQAKPDLISKVSSCLHSSKESIVRYDLRKATSLISQSSLHQIAVCERACEPGQPICLTLQDSNYRVLYLQAESRSHTDLWESRLRLAWELPAGVEGTRLDAQYLTQDEVPVAVDNALKHISTHGVLLADIYRRSGQQSKLIAMVELMRVSPWTILRFPETVSGSGGSGPGSGRRHESGAGLEEHTFELAAALKLYLRSLSECILTEKLYADWERVGGMPESEEKLHKYKKLIKQLPMINYRTLKRIIVHLVSISQHADKNKMNAYNLSVVMGPSILYSRSDSTNYTIAKQSLPMDVLFDLITHFRPLFDVTQEEEDKERRIQTCLIIHREAKLMAAKPAGDFLQAVYIFNKLSGRCLNVKVSPSMTTSEVLDYAMRTAPIQRPREGLALYEVLWDGLLERPMRSEERILDVILWRWKYFPVTSSQTNHQVALRSAEHYLIVRDCRLVEHFNREADSFLNRNPVGSGSRAGSHLSFASQVPVLRKLAGGGPPPGGGPSCGGSSKQITHRQVYVKLEEGQLTVYLNPTQRKKLLEWRVTSLLWYMGSISAPPSAANVSCTPGGGPNKRQFCITLFDLTGGVAPQAEPAGGVLPAAWMLCCANERDYYAWLIAFLASSSITASTSSSSSSSTPATVSSGSASSSNQSINH